MNKLLKVSLNDHIKNNFCYLPEEFTKFITDNFLSISNQEDGNIMSQQENERAAVFDLTTPLADLESDVFFFVCPPQYPLLQRCSIRVADKGLHQGR